MGDPELNHCVNLENRLLVKEHCKVLYISRDDYYDLMMVSTKVMCRMKCHKY